MASPHSRGAPSALARPALLVTGCASVQGKTTVTAAHEADLILVEGAMGLYWLSAMGADLDELVFTDCWGDRNTQEKPA